MWILYRRYCDSLPQLVRAGFVIAILSGTLFAPATVVAQSRRHGSIVPSAEKMLSQFGFEATAEGIAAALESDAPFARVYALRVLAKQTTDAASLTVPIDSVRAQLGHEYARVPLEAAKVLLKIDDVSAGEWLSRWKEEDRNCRNADALEADVLLDVASLMAGRGDESLVSQVTRCVRHPAWSVRIHAARALSDFRAVQAPACREAWLEAIAVAGDAAAGRIDVADDQYNLYLNWLDRAAARRALPQTQIQIQVEALERIEHEPSRANRQNLRRRWQQSSVDGGPSS